MARSEPPHQVLFGLEAIQQWVARLAYRQRKNVEGARKCPLISDETVAELEERERAFTVTAQVLQPSKDVMRRYRESVRKEESHEPVDLEP